MLLRIRAGNGRRLGVVAGALALAAGMAFAPGASAQVSPTAFTYQGEVKDGGVPASGTYDLKFSWYSEEVGGSPRVAPLCFDNVALVDGRFTVTLDFGDTGTGPIYIEIDVRADTGLVCGDDAGFTTVVPRQGVTSSPRAGVANSALNSQTLSGLGVGYFTNASNLSSGTIANSRLAPTVVRSDAGNVFTGANQFTGPSFFNGQSVFTNPFNTFVGSGVGLTGLWKEDGNAGTNPLIHYVGTIDDVPLNFRSNNWRVGVLSSAEGVLPAPTFAPFRSANVNFGSWLNTIASGVKGATIIGGGADRYGDGSPIADANRVGGDFGLVAGGLGNNATGFASAVVGGQNGSASNFYSAVLGGAQGQATNVGAATVGGFQAQATGGYSFVGAGIGNRATGSGAAVGGGDTNLASGQSAYVAGGSLNHATGRESLAAGFRARALHDHAYVWAGGSSGQDFESTGAGQYLINAPGGVGIGTNQPGAKLDVRGSGGVNIFTGDLTPYGTAGLELNFSSAGIGNNALIYCSVEDQPRFVVTGAGDAYASASFSAGSRAILDGTGQATGVPEVRLTQNYEPAGISMETDASFYSIVNLDNNFRLEGRNSSSAPGGAVRVDARPGVQRFQFWARSTNPSPTETLAASLTAAGNFVAAGTITGTAKFFEIDHPGDPENKTIKHACIESNEYKTIYDGVVVTDASGYATVQMPAWMTQLNEGFRYQLTIIDEGDSGDPLMWARVAKKIDGSNAFTIRTSGPNIEVSWQVTGVRKDAWAKANPFAVEKEKASADRGKYLTPEAYGKPASDAVNSGANFDAKAAAVEGKARRPRG